METSFVMKKVAKRTMVLAVVFLLFCIGNSLHGLELAKLSHTEGLDRASVVKRAANCIVKPFTDISDFFGYIDQELYPCRNKVKFGGVIRTVEDGEKYVCMDEEVGPSKDHCLVYSFGIENEWSFDDAIARIGCKVFAFDPTMNRADHQRSENVSFYNLGLSDYTGTHVILGAKRKVAHLSTIMDQLGHTGREIDYFKIDIEGMEVEVFEDLLTKHPEIMALIKQIGVEIHPGKYQGEDVTNPRSPFNRWWKIFQLLDCQGFRLFHWNRNAGTYTHYKWHNTLRASCYELAFVRVD